MNYSYLSDLWGKLPKKKILLPLLIVAAFVFGYYLPKGSDTRVATVEQKTEQQKASAPSDSHDHSAEKPAS